MIILDDKIMGNLQCFAFNASKEIYISCYKVEIKHSNRGKKLLKFWDYIYEAAERGVKVHFLLNWNDLRRSVAKTNLYVAQELKKHGCKVRYLKGTRCCHAKIFIFDDNLCIIGSHNLSVKSVTENFEMSYLAENKEEISQAKKIFQELWNDAKDF